jgi:hypothetical protein
MRYDEDKIDEYTLALLYLVCHERHEGMGARAWKGFDWETFNRLYEKGYISNPAGRAKSVGMTEEGFLKAKELFEKHFVKDLKLISLPRLTEAAKKRWNQIPERGKKELLSSVWCTSCQDGTSMQIREGDMVGRSLVFHGICKKCGSEVSRVIEPDKE